MKVKGGNFKSTIELISQGRRSMTSIISWWQEDVLDFNCGRQSFLTHPPLTAQRSFITNKQRRSCYAFSVYLAIIFRIVAVCCESNSTRHGEGKTLTQPARK